jgi:hypothetical protein
MLKITSCSNPLYTPYDEEPSLNIYQHQDVDEPLPELDDDDVQSINWIMLAFLTLLNGAMVFIASALWFHT